MAGTILVGYDVETASDSTAGFLKGAQSLHRDLGIPWTVFLTGQTMEARWKDCEAVAGDPLLTPAQHTYSHALLKTVYMQPGDGKPIHGRAPNCLKEGASLDKIEQEISKTQEIFRRLFGKDCRGLTGPYGYYRGLCDRPDILRILDRAGLRWIRTYARDERDCQPVSLDVQPFFYGDQGAPEILECPMQGYQDDFYWDRFDDRRHGPRYEDYLSRMVDVVVEHDLVWSVASHDHKTPTIDDFRREKEVWLRPFFEKALFRGVRFLGFEAYYRERTGGSP